MKQKQISIAITDEQKLPVVGWTTGEVISLNYAQTHTEEQAM